MRYWFVFLLTALLAGSAFATAQIDTVDCEKTEHHARFYFTTTKATVISGAKPDCSVKEFYSDVRPTPDPKASDYAACQQRIEELKKLGYTCKKLENARIE